MTPQNCLCNMQSITSGRLVYHIVHMIFLIGRLHLGKRTAQNEVYHLEHRYSLPPDRPPSQVLTPNLETGWINRNEAVGVGDGNGDCVRSSASGEVIEHSMKFSIYATSLHLRTRVTRHYGRHRYKLYLYIFKTDLVFVDL